MTAAISRRLPALEFLRVNLIWERARARISQEELAKRSGVSRPTISRIERASADVGIGVVQRIADALGVSVAKLFDEPIGDDNVDDVSDAELARRLADGPENFVEADALLAAIDEAAGRPRERYSRAGRPPLDRKTPSGRPKKGDGVWR
jgi:transcriptional regulator with XRE-family HTH domain